MRTFYTSLGLKPIDNLNNKLLIKSIRRHFKTIEIYNFNSILYLFSNCNLNKKILNNSNQLIKILKKKKYIHTNGSIYKGIIKYKNKYLYKTIFIKEVPIINPTVLNINMDQSQIINYKNFILSRYINSYNSASNIELLCCYLTSKLFELNISPHFPLFYGYNVVILDKYTSEVSEDWIDLNFELIDFDKNLIIKNNNNFFLQRNNFPCLLIYMENMVNDLYHYIYQSGKILEYEWSCYIFQVIAGLTVVQKYYNLYHNDLHLSNIMYNYTTKKYLYYKFNTTYFRINTYNKIIKIIDWGRSTYHFNNNQGNNITFNVEGEAFGQYINNRINNQGKNYIDYNPSIDLYILGKNLITIDKFPNKGNLKNLVNKWINYSSSDHFNDESFDMYIRASKEAYNGIPKEQFYSIVFKKFIINKFSIPRNEIIYNL